jgi:hypothetical protein
MTLPITINGTNIPTNKNPKILGLTLDPKLTFTPHTQLINQKARNRLNSLKALAAHSWGQDQETLTLVYKQYVRSLLEYAAPAWHPSLSVSNLTKLQTTQNQALRIITGCTLMTPIPHLHSETKVLPLDIHSNMIGTQFYAKISDPSHPAHHLTAPPSGPRNMKTTPAQKYIPLLQKYNPTSTTDLNLHQIPSTKSIHTVVVQEYLANQPPNKMLSVSPPALNPSESTLPRKDRIILSQLRSGYSPLLRDYLNKINRSPTNSCRFCSIASETPLHIFKECLPLTPLRNAHDISPFSLWRDPERALAFLSDLGLREPCHL